MRSLGITPTATLLSGALALGALALGALGCGGGSSEDDDGASTGSGAGASSPSTSIAVLGNGSHDVTKATLVEVGSQIDGLDTPRDLAFNPQVPAELWVVNIADDSTVVFSNAGLPSQTAQKFVNAPESQHFMPKPSALAFGAPGFFATIHDEDQPTQGGLTPFDFMGPVLWTSNLSTFDGGVASHYDMLHNSPLGMGIAWERDRVYWVFDGYHSSITRYDFGMDHGPAGTDHTDGTITRYVEGQVTRVPGPSSQSTPSHMEFLAGTRRLFIADSGNGRIAELDTAIGTPSGPLNPNYDSCTMNRVDGATVRTVADGNVDQRMPYPSGITIRNVLVGGEPRDVIFVSDIVTSTVYGWSLDGLLLDWLPLGLPQGSLSGITFDEDGNLWLVDGIAHRVLRLEAPPPAG